MYESGHSTWPPHNLDIQKWYTTQTYRSGAQPRHTEVLVNLDMYRSITQSGHIQKCYSTWTCTKVVHSLDTYKISHTIWKYTRVATQPAHVQKVGTSLNTTKEVAQPGHTKLTILTLTLTLTTY